MNKGCQTGEILGKLDTRLNLNLGHGGVVGVVKNVTIRQNNNNNSCVAFLCPSVRICAELGRTGAKCQFVRNAI